MIFFGDLGESLKRAKCDMWAEAGDDIINHTLELTKGSQANTLSDCNFKAYMY